MTKKFTIVLAILCTCHFLNAQGVKQLWGTISNKLYSIDTASLTLTARKDFTTPQDGLYLVDFKLVDGKIYGTQLQGWFLYEFDPMKQTNNFSGIVALPSVVQVTPHNGAVRHITRKSGNLYIANNKALNLVDDPEYPTDFDFMTISKWDINNQVFSKPYSEEQLGAIGPLVEFNNKFYGLNNNPEIFEWEPDNATITKRKSLLGSTLSATSSEYDYKRPVAFGNKLYILAHDHILEWDPQTDGLEIRHSFDIVDAPSDGARFSLIEVNGKLYGMTALGGTNNEGVIFEWDPVTGDYEVKINFTDFGMKGYDVINLIEDDNSGEIFAIGLNNILQYNPSNNKIIVKNMNGIPYGKNYQMLPAPVSLFTPNSCTSFPSVTISTSNNSGWVPITDSKGDVLAEIQPHNNNLGLLDIHAYINEGAVRTDGQGKPYLDRNITITPATQPGEGNPVDIRLYITKAEFEALRAAPNSGINDIADLAIFKSSEACSGTVTNAVPVTTTYEDYEFGYVLKATIISFSTFYFSNRVFESLPLQLLDFSATLQNDDAVLLWKTDNEHNTHSFDIERSEDGVHFSIAGNIAANNTAGKHQYHFTDKDITELSSSVVYYRLNQKDIDGKAVYSKIISINLPSARLVTVSPNPAGNYINVKLRKQLNTPNTLIQITDMGGRKVIEQKINPSTNTHKINTMTLSKGVYMISIINNGERITSRFVKQ
jgi:hypothetical protein